jgi:hypothetical protein
LNDWHLELSAGQYRGPRDGHLTARRVNLVHNIVFSMPSSTPPGKILAVARKFAREKLAFQHRYAMALHTDQQHPRVDMVVKAESEQGRRLHIDKTMLREWREDFARLMREQGIAANATPRALRGKNKGKTKDAIYRARRRGASHAVRDCVKDVVNELMSTGTVYDPAKRHMLETRRAVVAAWAKTADQLDTQGETILAREVRHCSRHLPPVLTDRERLAVQFLRHRASRRATAPTIGENIRRRDDPLTG